MAQNNLPVTLCLVTGFLVVANLGMNPWIARQPFHKKLEEIRLAHDPTLLFIGNSLLDSRVDVLALQSGYGPEGWKILPLNAALGGTDPHVQALLMNESVRDHPTLHTVVIGVFDFQLTKEERFRPGDLTGNDSVGLDKRFPREEVDKIYQFSKLEDLELRLLRMTPMVAYRTNAWKYVEILRRGMGEMGMPHAETNKNGRVADFAALEAGTPDHFDQEAGEYLNKPAAFNNSYESIFLLAQQRHLGVVIVLMPMSPTHRQTYYSRPSWSHYFSTERQQLEKRGFTVIDASDWMPRPDQFVDSLHMSAAGGSEFSFRIGQELRQAGLF